MQFITLEGGKFLVRIKMCVKGCQTIFGLSLEGSECPNLECRKKLIEVDVPEEELKEKLDKSKKSVVFDNREVYT